MCWSNAYRCAIAPNVLDRQFEADSANQKWVADFTYIWTAEGLAVRGRRARPVLQTHIPHMLRRNNSQLPVC